MTALVLVDTNVFVYAHTVDEPAKRNRAREWLEILWNEQRGRTSIQVLTEFFSVATRGKALDLSQDEAWEVVRSLSAWQPHALDTESLNRAHDLLRRYELNWWDCLVVAAAQAQGCSLLLTEDLQDKANYGGIVVRNPFTLSVAEEHLAYTALPKIASRHRGRGRPRRTPARTAATG